MLSFPAVACTVRLGRPCFFFPGRSRSRIPTPSGPGPKVSAIRPPFMCAFCIPCASPGLPRPVIPQRIPTARPPIRATVRAIPKAQHRGASGLTPLFATLPQNPPVSLIIATLPKSCSRNPFVCHTYETPPGGYPPQTFAPIFSHLATRHSPLSRNSFRMRTYKKGRGEGYVFPIFQFGFSRFHVRARSRSPDSTLVPRFPAAAAGGDSCIFPSCQL